MSVIQYPSDAQQSPYASVPNIVYTVTSSFPPGKTRPRSFHKNDKPSDNRDSKDNVPHAALINIVAAVNVDLPGQTCIKRQVKDAFEKAMSVAERPLSIPKPKQRIFNMPDETVQRKPVYYKNSPDLEVRRESRIRLTDNPDGICFKVNPVNINRPNVQPVPRLPLSKPCWVDCKSASTRKTDTSATANNKCATSRDTDRRTASGVRKLGYKKPTAYNKTVQELPKCDAVDLMDTQDDDPAMSVLDDSRKLIPSGAQISVPYIRTKSLPAIFPTKTSKQRPDTVPLNNQRIFKDRPLSQNIRAWSSVFVPRSRNLNYVEGSLCIHRLNRCYDQSSSTVSKTTRHVHEMDLPGDTPIVNINRSMDNRYQRVMSGKSSICTDASVKTTISTLSIRGCLTSRTLNTGPQSSERNGSKKVQFAGSSLSNKPENKSFNSKVGAHSETCPKPVSCSKENKQMSEQELFIVQQRVLPANTPREDQMNSFPGADSALTIQAINRAYTDVYDPSISRFDPELNHGTAFSNLDNTTKNSLNMDHNTSGLSDIGQRIRERDCLRGSRAESSLEDFSDSTSSSSDDDDDDDDCQTMQDIPALSICKNDTIEYYRLFKAVDLHSYDSFEHKKIRKSASSSRSKNSKPQKSVFVKVRLT